MPVAAAGRRSNRCCKSTEAEETTGWSTAEKQDSG